MENNDTVMLVKVPEPRQRSLRGRWSPGGRPSRQRFLAPQANFSETTPPDTHANSIKWNLVPVERRSLLWSYSGTHARTAPVMHALQGGSLWVAQQTGRMPG